ncbi:MAG: thioesterase family protein [Parvibaculum sp.]|nr:thioesterase family protein [Parvibaculum sp.]
MSAPDTGMNPVFRFDGGIWQARAESKGPFGGMHGGAVAALGVGEMETAGAARGLGAIVSANLYLLRPLPREDITSKLTTIREGGRIAVIENELFADGKLQAKASACFQKALAIDGLPGAPDAISFEPETFPVWERPTVFRNGNVDPGFLDLVDIRDIRHEDGTRAKWFKLLRPFHAEQTPFANAMAFADVSTLFTVTDVGKMPNSSGWPNADLSLHLARAPLGAWIGVAQRGFWQGDGRGLTESEIFDVHGRIGRSCQSVVLLPPQ